MRAWASSALVVAILAIAFFLIQRAYGGPWGRMMRAIRDNHIAAASMGKNITRRQLEIFVLGSVLMGIGGAILVSFQQIYDPGSYQPINHTFLIWVMVIVGGAGNNWGAVFGALLIYIAWMISDPLGAVAVQRHFQLVDRYGLGRHPRDPVARQPDARARAGRGHHHRPALRPARPDPEVVKREA